MRVSRLFGRTLREAPGEAEHPAHRLALRAGLVQSMQTGSYALLPLGMRVVRRIEAIMHEAMARSGGQEFRTPIIQVTDAWEQSGRYEQYGPLMLRLTDRGERSLLVAPTHEEAVAELARHEIASYRQLPVLLYQIHTKYRDEPRARGGLLRMREFTMLDAYSLDADEEGLEEVYQRVGQAFERILVDCGVHFVVAEAASGEMGGGASREFLALSELGEDTVAICDSCGHVANLEVASSAPPPETEAGDAPQAMEEVATPNSETIAAVAGFLGVPTSATAKAVFFDTPEHGLLFVVIRGDMEVNETKLRALAGVSDLTPASDEQIRAVGATPGYASPVGLTGVRVIADRSIPAAGPLVAGANRPGYHLRNVVYGRDWTAHTVGDIATVREGDPCPRCTRPLRLARATELGHIFKLGTRYSEPLGVTYLDQDGKTRPVLMGSYGIGVERLLQVIIEQHHDAKGIIWPLAVAPFDIYFLHLGKEEEVRNAARELYHELTREGHRVLYDDRDERAGVKFNDADLIGLPLRLVLSARLLEDQLVEVKTRTGDLAKVRRADLSRRVDSVLSRLKAEERLYRDTRRQG